MPDINYLKNGMFLYFDKQGNLKEQINDSPLRQGNSGVNKIYIFWEKADSENIVGLWSRYTRALRDTMDVKPSATTYFDDFVKVSGAIPFNDKRDLKFFKYYQEYEFYEITIPESVLAIGDTTWLCSLWFVLDQDNDNTNNGITQDVNGNVSGYDTDEVSIFAMGGVAFYVIPLGLSIASDENINIAQWNYLMWKLDTLQNLYNQGLGELTDNIKTFSGRITDKTGLAFTDETKDENIDYKVVLGGEFYNAYFYDRNIGEEVRFSDMYDDLEGVKLNIPLLAKDLVVSMDTSNYQITFTLKNLNNQVISTQTLDLPLESLIVSGEYDSQTESIILTLQNGNTIDIPVGDLVDGLVSSDYLTNNYYNKTTMDGLLDAKANQVQLVATTTRLDNEISGIKERTTILEFDVSALKTNSAFTYNPTTQEYEAKSDINMKGLDIDGVMELFSSDVFTANLYGLNNNDILLRNDINGNQKTIKNIYLETPNITLTPPEDSSAFIYVGDESILSVDEYQNVIIGCDNAGSLTFETQNNSVDFDDLMATLNAKANITDINSLATSKIDEIKVNNVSLQKTTIGSVVSVNVDLTPYATNTALKTYAKSLEVSMNTTTYVATFLLKDGDGNTLSTQTLDFPLESVVVNGTYDSTNQKIVLTLQNGNTIDIPVSSLVSGLVSNDYLTTNYYTKTQIDTNNYTKTQVNNLLSAKANAVDNPFTYNAQTGNYENLNANANINTSGGIGADSITTSFLSSDEIVVPFNALTDFTSNETLKTLLDAKADESSVITLSSNVASLSNEISGVKTRTTTLEMDVSVLKNQIVLKADTSDVLLKTDATTTSTANKVVMRDSAGNIEGNYLKSTWLYSSGASDTASWSDVWVNNGGWLYKRSKSSFISDLGVATASSIPQHQAYTCVVANATTNLNGYSTGYSYTDTTISGYTAKKITSGGSNLTYSQAQTYMNIMTGSDFVPQYNQTRPRNTLFLFADNTIWKPQYDSTNGMVLYFMSAISPKLYRHNILIQANVWSTSATAAGTTTRIIQFEIINNSPTSLAYSSARYVNDELRRLDITSASNCIIAKLNGTTYCARVFSYSARALCLQTINGNTASSTWTNEYIQCLSGNYTCQDYVSEIK